MYPSLIRIISDKSISWEAVHTYYIEKQITENLGVKHNLDQVMKTVHFLWGLLAQMNWIQPTQRHILMYTYRIHEAIFREKTIEMLLAYFRMVMINKRKLVVATRFELATPTMSRWCSNQLSYATITE